MRGLRKCPSCGGYNGNRAKGCANAKCSLHYLKKGPDRKKPLIDAIQLVSYNDTKIFSVRVRDRDPAQRNFVQIVDVTLTADQDGSIVSRNAICFVDTCKYDSTDLNISCKHVKSASECLKQATEIKVSRDVLYAMNISTEMKDQLWSQYCEYEQMIPAVQRINKSTFVVKCKANAVHAAGRLHATISADDETESNFSCGCKKLRIILSPNNSVVMESATCDHLMLILAGLLSSESIRKDYQKFINSLSNLWVAESFSVGDSLLQSEDLISFSENILNSCIELTSADNSSDQKIFDSDPTMQTSAENRMEDEEIQLVSVPTNKDEITTEFETANLELAECQIELMDQFKLTNQIDLCNDDIQLCEADLFAENHIVCNMDQASQGDSIQVYENAVNSTVNKCSRNSVSNVGASPQVEKQKESYTSTGGINSNIVVENTLEFNSWLNFVIERINSAIDINTETSNIAQSYDMKHDFFTCLSSKFSVGDKRRIPNNTTMIKKGRYKGLVKSTWIFTTSSAVKRIFSTNESSVDLEHVYIEKSPGCYVPYDASSVLESHADTQNKKLKRILPSMFKAFIQFGSKNKTSTGGFAIEWIPNVFPKSRFGVMRIQFTLGFKKNNKIIEKFTPVGS
ncbi:unnamed protein product [Hermetia illucens]|uniref:Putative treble-clef zinc-finger domain-containing protein n=2 Tax=Hermetia illucens TaxID=343691 RepID=A0A7R8Z1Q7_HERIL|nr:unnamed protein product [Hermetia illucens]